MNECLFNGYDKQLFVITKDNGLYFLIIVEKMWRRMWGKLWNVGE